MWISCCSSSEVQLNLLCYPNPTADPCPCRKDLLHWDKAFVMLEDSQMRQNMLLHSVDGILAGELKGMRSEVRRGLADTAGACGLGRARVGDVASTRLAKLVEQQHQGTVKWHQENAKKLQEVFLLLLGLHDRLGGLEDQLGKPGSGQALPGEQGQCPTLTEELVQARAELGSLRARAACPHSETQSQEPPAGK
ncbi:hypothetical protein scyTo_0025427 [Scyliorhinus torazame]|uniref:PTX3-like N-terminal domain-containing protein n=1 Tax=Scyliorhinus torazame TaxID=75743 RepID=A0A401QHL7_SCYTO|nr:hypothetical protein [Scyliorhinus torazame]